MILSEKLELNRVFVKTFNICMMISLLSLEGYLPERLRLGLYLISVYAVPHCFRGSVYSYCVVKPQTSECGRVLTEHNLLIASASRSRWNQSRGHNHNDGLDMGDSYSGGENVYPCIYFTEDLQKSL